MASNLDDLIAIRPFFGLAPSKIIRIICSTFELTTLILCVVQKLDPIISLCSFLRACSLLPPMGNSSPNELFIPDWNVSLKWLDFATFLPVQLISPEWDRPFIIEGEEGVIDGWYQRIVPALLFVKIQHHLSTQNDMRKLVLHLLGQELTGEQVSADLFVLLSQPWFLCSYCLQQNFLKQWQQWFHIRPFAATL